MNKISIITAVRNNAGTIADCLASVRSQNWVMEHIIVDGLSTDQTLAIIYRNKSDNIRIISEMDNGVYDALNKGIEQATGDVIGILHADDFYARSEVVSHVAKIFEDMSIDSCYADLEYVDRMNTDRILRRWTSGPYDVRRFYWGWMPPHPTFFVRRKIYRKYGGFNLSFGTAADYELMLRFLVRHRITAVYIPEVFVKMRMGGMSNLSLANRLRANRMDRKAWRENGLKPVPGALLLKPLSKVMQYII